MLLKKYELTYDTIYKSNNITMNFNEFDVDTSDFVVTVTRKGVQVDLKGSIATIAVIKPNNSVDAQFIDVIDTSKLYCDLKSNMKNLPGTYEAMIMISNNGEHISIGPVKYFVQDNKPFAQLDSSISDDTRLTIVQELLDKLQPIYNTELQRIANEEDRLKAEELRKSLEILRIDAEELRVNNENTRVQSESTRVASENVRIESENFRVANENIRESNEATRVASEVSRASSEKIRENSEGDRLEAENTRQANEKNRVLNESQRQQNESDRVVNETQRVQNESNRQYFEEKRVEAELVRKQWYDKAFEGSEKMSVDEATRVENEAQRVNAETLRIQRESDRVTQETKREQQEVSRTSKENERLQAETTRQSNEGTRQSNENDRVAKESSRVQVEQSRVNAEKLRATNETTRIDSEQTRADNEKARVLAEQQRITEHQAREELLSGYDSRLASIENINETNTIRLNEMDRVNRNQAIAIQGLINEHSDKRISLTEDTHNINLDYATKGILEVDSIEGETLVNVSDQKDSVAISKAYNVEGTNHIALQGELDGKARPNIHGNTMVNVSSQKDKAPITLKYDDILGKEGKLLVGSVANKKGHVEIDKVVGNTLVNVATQKELVPVTKKYDDIVGNEGKLLVGDVANKKGHVEIDKIVGNTLVNIMSSDDEVTSGTTSIYNANWNIANVSSDSNISNHIFTINGGDTNILFRRRLDSMPLLKTSTTYTLIVEVISTDYAGTCTIGNSDKIVHKSLSYIFTSAGTKKILITTKDDFTDVSADFYIYFQHLLTGTLKFKMYILEGDYTNKPIPNEAFEGLQSSFEENLVTQEMVTQGLESEENLGKYKVPIRLIGKNLFDGKIVQGTIADATAGEATVPNSIRSGSFVKVEYGKTYYLKYDALSTNAQQGYPKIYYYDANMNYLVENTPIAIGGGAFTITNRNCKFIKFRIFAASQYPLTPNDISNAQLEEGTVATDYEEYFERTTNVYLNSPLLEGDTIEEIDGVVNHAHRYKQIVLDGSEDENWELQGSYQFDNTICFIGSNAIPIKKATGRTNFICKDFTCYANYLLQTSLDVEGFAINAVVENGSYAYIRINKSRLSTQDSAGFKAWLQSNPVTVVYELAEPYCEVISSDKLLLECANDSTLHIESIVPVENISFKSYEEELNYLYTSKVYTVQFNADSTGTCDITLGGAKLLNQSVKKGLNKFNITTLSTLVDNKLIINGEGFNVEEVAVVDTESNFDYFEGLESSFEGNLVTQEMVNEGLEDAENLGKYKVPAKLVGKNLFDGELELGSIDEQTGGLYSSDLCIRSKHYIKINSSNQYKVSNDMNYTLNIYFYDDNYTFIRYLGVSTIVSIPSNAKYIKFRTSIGKVENNLNCKFQIEEGTVATDYEDYFERTTNVYLNLPLLEGDEIVMKDGNLCHYHKMGSVVLDGSDDEGIVFNSGWSSIADVITFGSDLTPGIAYEDKSKNYLISDKVPTYSYNEGVTYSNGTNRMTVQYSSNLNAGRLIWSLEKNSYKLATFKQQLSSNPVTVVYELAEPYYEVIQTDKLILECANDSTLHIDTVVPVKSISFKAYEEELKYLYTSKDYKVKFTSDAIGTCDITLGGTKLVSQSIKVGINEFSITTPATLIDNKLVIEGEGFNIEKVSVVDTESNFDYFEGIYSCFENQLVTDEADPNFGKYKVDYKVTGKNKFDINNITLGYYYYGDVPAIYENGFYGIVKVKPNKQYTITFKLNVDFPYRPMVIEFDSNMKRTISHYSGATYQSNQVYTLTLTTDANTKYIALSQLDVSNDYIGSWEIQIEEGIEATTYEPYREFIKTFYLNSPLLKGDTIEEINGKTTHVHRYNSVVLDGSEDEGWIAWESEGSLLGAVTESIVYDNSKGSDIRGVCDKLPVVVNGITGYDSIGFRQIGDTRYRIYLSKLGMDVSMVKQWLNDNPIIVVYKLATPVYETVSEENRIIDSYVNGHLDLDSNVPVKKVDFRAWEGKLKYLYPSTTYTVQFVSDIDTKVNITLGGSLLSSQLATKGLNKFTIQTPATIDANEVQVDGIGANISKVLVTNSTREFNYFEGLKSSFEDNVTEEGKYKVPVRVVGKNLFDKSKVKFVGIDTTNGLEVDNEYYSSDFIKIKPNTSYIRSQGIGIYYYDNDKKFILFQNHRVKSPTNAFYCRVQLQKDWNLDTVQIEEGTVATSYEKYYEYNASVLLNSPLLKGDELVMKDGELCHYHKYIERIYDGSSDESLDFYSPTLAVMFKALKYTTNHYSNVKLVKATWENVDIFAYKLPTDSGVTNISQAREYLQSNPIKIVYELAEPWYEPIQIGKIMLECINNSIFTIDTDLPVKSSINYSASIPSVQAMSNDINSLQDTSVDIITSSWDTDYRLSEVEWILEDNGLLSPMMFNLETKSTRGGTSMAFTKFEQAKIMILAGAYDREVLTKQLQRYLEKGVITKTEYEDLIALMDANELVAGK